MDIPKEIFNKILHTQGLFVERLAGVNAERATRDFLSFEKPKEQIKIIQKYYPDLRGKKLLEIGSGLGVFNLVSRIEFGVDSWGIEPSGEGFGQSLEISHEILRENNLPAERVLNSKGEALPFEDNSFDVVFSTNVLEHVESPEKVIGEAIRVCKNGGIIQIVVPNYGSFFDGHYACFYLPYQPKWLWKIYLKYFLNKSVDFVDELRTEINYFSVQRWLGQYVRSGTITVLDMGEEVFKERMNNIDFSAWAGLEKIKNWLKLVHRLRITKLVTWLLVITKSYSPLIITLRKNL